MIGKQSTLNDLIQLNEELAEVNSKAEQALNKANLSVSSSSFIVGLAVPTNTNPNDITVSGTYHLYVPLGVPVEFGGRAQLEVDASKTGEYIKQTLTSLNSGHICYRVGLPDGEGGANFADWEYIYTTVNTIVDADGFIKTV